MDALRSAHCLLHQKPTSVFGGSPVSWKCGVQANVVVSMKFYCIRGVNLLSNHAA
jgi:hypothetical protein